VEYVDAAGTGRLYSFTIVHRSPAEGIEVPYVVALVDLDEGPRLLTRIVAAEHGELACDKRVVLAWDPLPDGRALPVFKLT
jgi:uncharacterized OB-fold protein